MERLGWESNCPHGDRCPQSWLTRSVVELPLELVCHVCRGPVRLERSRSGYERVRDAHLAAWPIFPPIALHAVSPDAGRVVARASLGTFEEPVEEPSPPRKRALEKPWYVELNGGARIAVDKPTMVLGRSRNCDIIIPSAKVSRQHATLSLVGSDLYIEDLGSSNGVWHNGRRVSRERLNPGDVVIISDEALRFGRE
ncbi:MAG: FHA domain-containing protein [Myxococcales bacterium]|nr:FHA domain-containing protein [Myxococcales bacterium]